VVNIGWLGSHTRVWLMVPSVPTSNSDIVLASLSETISSECGSSEDQKYCLRYLTQW
jgi:hypothetical protein